MKWEGEGACFVNESGRKSACINVSSGWRGEIPLRTHTTQDKPQRSFRPIHTFHEHEKLRNHRLGFNVKEDPKKQPILSQASKELLEKISSNMSSQSNQSLNTHRNKAPHAEVRETPRIGPSVYMHYSHQVQRNHGHK